MKIAAFEDATIWGIGDSESEAKTEAEGHIRDQLPDDLIEVVIENLRTAPISDELLAEFVDTATGDTPFKLDGSGILVLTGGEPVAEDNFQIMQRGQKGFTDADIILIACECLHVVFAGALIGAQPNF